MARSHKLAIYLGAATFLVIDNVRRNNQAKSCTSSSHDDDNWWLAQCSGIGTFAVLFAETSGIQETSWSRIQKVEFQVVRFVGSFTPGLLVWGSLQVYHDIQKMDTR